MWRELTTFHVGCGGGTFQSRHARIEFRMTEFKKEAALISMETASCFFTEKCGHAATACKNTYACH